MVTMVLLSVAWFPSKVSVAAAVSVVFIFMLLKINVVSGQCTAISTGTMEMVSNKGILIFNYDINMVRYK
jgi:hypothetical protein